MTVLLSGLADSDPRWSWCWRSSRRAMPLRPAHMKCALRTVVDQEGGESGRESHRKCHRDKWARHRSHHSRGLYQITSSWFPKHQQARSISIGVATRQVALKVEVGFPGLRFQDGIQRVRAGTLLAELPSMAKSSLSCSVLCQFVKRSPTP